MKYVFYLGKAVINNETFIANAPQIDCRLVKLLFNVVQPMPTRQRSWRSRGYAERCAIRERRVKNCVRLEQIQFGNVVLLIEDHKRIGNGSLVSRAGLPLALFEPHMFAIEMNGPILRKDTPMALKLYGSSYGLAVHAHAIVDSAACTCGPLAPTSRRIIHFESCPMSAS